MISLGDRMKENYENRYRIKLTRRVPVIMRLDGRAFHTLTRSYERPFDYHFSDAMQLTADYLIGEIQGAKMAYAQSDEISILITDFDRLNTDAWFDYNIQKMCSISAGLASAFFSRILDERIAVFDSRVANYPKEEVCNYFIWRQKDWTRNSVSMLAQAHFSHKQLHGVSVAGMHEMLHGVGVNWADLDARFKNGMTVFQDRLADDIIFTKDRDVIEKLLETKEE